MLIDFTAENNLSFYEETMLTMQTGNRLKKFDDTHVIHSKKVNLLKTAIIFGPNGSGKTNMFVSLQNLKHLILTLGETENSTNNIRKRSFKMDKEGKSKPTKFVITLLLQGKIYEYLVRHDTKRIINEKLTDLTTDKENILFERYDNEQENLEWYINKNEIDESLIKFTRKNNLFLNILANFNNEIAMNIIDWFQNKLISFSDDTDFRFTSLAAELLNEEFKEEVLSLLKIADFNIVDLEIEEQDVDPSPRLLEFLEEEFNIGADKRPIKTTFYDIDFLYNVYDSEGKVVDRVKVDISQESKGTVKMLYLASMIVDSMNQGRTILFDEFDNAFHLEICNFLISLFNSKRNSNNQFILTTHELEILDFDLRSDQIWFVEKNYRNESKFYSLFDFNDMNKRKRSDVSYVKKYMKGQFGAKPVIDEFSAQRYIQKEQINLNLFESNIANGESGNE